MTVAADKLTKELDGIEVLLDTDYFEFIKNYANYEKWFFGHYHDNKNVSAEEILLYEQIIRIR